MARLSVIVLLEFPPKALFTLVVTFSPYLYATDPYQANKIRREYVKLATVDLLGKLITTSPFPPEP